MGSFLLILGLLFSLLVAVVAMANNNPVPVNYLVGHAEVPLILLILGSAACGAVAAGLFSVFRGIRTALKFREGRRRLEELERQVKELKLDKAALETRLELMEAQFEDSAAQPDQQAPPESPANDQAEPDQA